MISDKEFDVFRILIIFSIEKSKEKKTFHHGCACFIIWLITSNSKIIQEFSIDFVLLFYCHSCTSTCTLFSGPWEAISIWVVQPYIFWPWIVEFVNHVNDGVTCVTFQSKQWTRPKMICRRLWKLPEIPTQRKARNLCIETVAAAELYSWFIRHRKESDI